MCWAGCESPLHCPDPSFLKAASKLSPHYPRQIGRVLGAQGGGGQIPAPLEPNRIHLHYSTHQSLLHIILSITVHFNGSNGTAYIRPLTVRYINTYNFIPLIFSIQLISFCIFSKGAQKDPNSWTEIIFFRNFEGDSTWKFGVWANH